MENKNIIFTHTLEQYKEKYSKRNFRLLKYTKKEIDEFDKKNKTNKYLLEGRKWWFINGTYYEVPKPIRFTWFRNLNAATQIATCLLGAGVIAASVAVPVTLFVGKNNVSAIVDSSVQTLAKIEEKGQTKDGGKIFEISAKSNKNKVTSIENVYIGDDLLAPNVEYTFESKNDAVTLIVKKEAFDKHSGVLKVKPKVEPKSPEPTGKCILKLESNPKNIGAKFKGAGEYSEGENVDISTTKVSGYTFIGWYENDRLLSGDLCFTYTISYSVTLTAKYKEDEEVLAEFDYFGYDSYDYPTSVEEDIVYYTISCNDDTRDYCTKAEIPSKYKNKPVKALAEDCFAYSTNLKSVDFGKSSNLEAFLDGSFYGCQSLESITVPAKVNYIGSYSFNGCSSLGTAYFEDEESSWSIEDVTDKWFPVDEEENAEILTYYSSSQFSKNEDEEVEAEYLYYGYDKGGVVTSIENEIVEYRVYCVNYDECTKAVIPAEYNDKPVTGIHFENDGGFEGCELLKTVSFEEPDNIKYICDSAFSGCKSLETITIPKNVVEIGENAFDNCDALETIYFEDTSSQLSIMDDSHSETQGTWTPTSDGSENLETLLENSGYKFVNTNLDIVGNLIYHAFDVDGIETEDEDDASEYRVECGRNYYYCNKAIIPDTHNNKPISGIYYNNSSPGWGGFAYCDELLSVEYDNPQNIKYICKGAFEDCKKLTSITIPENVEEIGEGAFSGCELLESVTFEDKDNSWTIRDKTTKWKPGTAKENAIALTSTYVEDSWAKNVSHVLATYYYYPLDSNLIWTDDPEKIVSYGINCNNKDVCTKAIIPNTYNEKPVYILDDDDGVGAFQNCTNLTTVTFEKDSPLQAFEPGCFYGCTKLTSIVIPKHLCFIGAGSFFNSGLESAVFKDVESGWTITGAGIPDLWYPSSPSTNADMLTEYDEHTYWEKKTDYQEATFTYVPYNDEGEKVTEAEATQYGIYCNNCEKCEVAEIPDTYKHKPVTRFDTWSNGKGTFGAFANASNLRSITFENSDNLTYIGWKCFIGCEKLLSFTIPKNVTFIDSYAFAEADGETNFEEVYFEDTETEWKVSVQASTPFKPGTGEENIAKLKQLNGKQGSKFTKYTQKDSFINKAKVFEETYLAHDPYTLEDLNIVDYALTSNKETTLTPSNSHAAQLQQFISFSYLTVVDNNDENIYSGLVIDVSFYANNLDSILEDASDTVSYTITDDYIEYKNSNPTGTGNILSSLKINKNGYIEEYEMVYDGEVYMSISLTYKK